LQTVLSRDVGGVEPRYDEIKRGKII